MGGAVSLYRKAVDEFGVLPVAVATAGTATLAVWYVARGRNPEVPSSVSKVQSVYEFDKAKFAALIGENKLGGQISYESVVTSTMTLAQSEIDQRGAAATHGKIFLAEAQTAGVGRRKRGWTSMPQGNIYVSFVWDVGHLDSRQRKFQKLKQLNLACGVAVAKAARAENVDAHVKWPNDVWVGSRKLSGMIVDFKDRREAGAVVGIGVNVNQDPSSFDDATKEVATSVFGEKGSQVSREAFLANMLATIEKLMRRPIEETMQTYADHDMLIGKVVRVFHKSREESDPRDYDATVLGYQMTDEESKLGTLKVAPVDDPSNIKCLAGEEISVRPV